MCPIHVSMKKLRSGATPDIPRYIQYLGYSIIKLFQLYQENPIELAERGTIPIIAELLPIDFVARIDFSQELLVSYRLLDRNGE